MAMIAAAHATGMLQGDNLSVFHALVVSINAMIRVGASTPANRTASVICTRSIKESGTIPAAATPMKNFSTKMVTQHKNAFPRLGISWRWLKTDFIHTTNGCEKLKSLPVVAFDQTSQ